MSIVVGHDVDPGMIPYEAAYMMSLQGNPVTGGSNSLAARQAQAEATNARLRPQGNQIQALKARRAAGQEPDSAAGFDWQTPIQVFHDSGAQQQQGGSMFAPHANYDTLYQSQGVDPLANAAGVAGASAGFGKLGSREQTVYDPGNIINPNDPMDRANLGRMANALPYGNNTIDQGTADQLFLSPDEQRRKADDEKFNTYQRQQGVVSGNRQQLEQIKAANRAADIKTKAGIRANEIAQSYGLKGDLQKTALAAELEREHTRLDQQKQFHDDNMTMAGKGSVDAARRLISELDHMSPEELALYGSDASTRIAQLKGAISDYDNHAVAQHDPAGAAAVAAGLFNQLQKLEASKSQEKTLDFQREKEKALEDRAAAAAIAKVSAQEQAQQNRLEAQTHAAQLHDQAVPSRDYNTIHGKLATKSPWMTAEQLHEETLKQMDLKQQSMPKSFLPGEGDPQGHSDLLQQDLPPDHPTLAMVETLAKSLKDAGVPLDKAREIIAARLGEQGAAA